MLKTGKLKTSILKILFCLVDSLFISLNQLLNIGLISYLEPATLIKDKNGSLFIDVFFANNRVKKLLTLH